MQLTIIGVYDEQAHPRSAKYELIASGFSPRKVQLTPDEELAVTRKHPVEEADRKGSTLNAGFGNFFRSLLGPANRSAYGNLYGEAVKRGGFVLTVDVDSDEQRVRAEEIMTHHGPVDIDERSALWVQQGWRGHDPAAASEVGAPAKEAGGKLRSVLRRKEKGEQGDH